MKKEYIVIDVLHSGRKGERYTSVNQSKYEGLIGYTVKFDLDKLEQNKSLHMDVKNSPVYDWWDTSMVVSVTVNEETNYVLIETVNSIYELEEYK